MAAPAPAEPKYQRRMRRRDPSPPTPRRPDDTGPPSPDGRIGAPTRSVAGPIGPLPGRAPSWHGPRASSHGLAHRRGAPRTSTPVARRGRKATGLPESAGLPNGATHRCSGTDIDGSMTRRRAVTPAQPPPPPSRRARTGCRPASWSSPLVVLVVPFVGACARAAIRPAAARRLEVDLRGRHPGDADERSLCRGRWYTASTTTPTSATRPGRPTRKGATVSLTFTGTAIAWVGPVGPTRGSARVYLDGKLIGTVEHIGADLPARPASCSRKFDTMGKHRIVKVTTAPRATRRSPSMPSSSAARARQRQGQGQGAEQADAPPRPPHRRRRPTEAPPAPRRRPTRHADRRRPRRPRHRAPTAAPRRRAHAPTAAPTASRRTDRRADGRADRRADGRPRPPLRPPRRQPRPATDGRPDPGADAGSDGHPGRRLRPRRRRPRRRHASPTPPAPTPTPTPAPTVAPTATDRRRQRPRRRPRLARRVCGASSRAVDAAAAGSTSGRCTFRGLGRVNKSPDHRRPGHHQGLDGWRQHRRLPTNGNCAWPAARGPSVFIDGWPSVRSAPGSPPAPGFRLAVTSRRARNRPRPRSPSAGTAAHHADNVTIRRLRMRPTARRTARAS